MLRVDVIKTFRSEYPPILFVDPLFFFVLRIIHFLTKKYLFNRYYIDCHRNKPPIPVHRARMEHDRSLQIEGG